MDITFKATIPGVAYSQVEVKGCWEDFVKVAKEIDSSLNELPSSFFITIDDTFARKQIKANDAIQRLKKANEALVEIQKKHPEVKATLISLKENNG